MSETTTIRKIYRWNGIGRLTLPNGSMEAWPVRNPVFVTEDPKWHSKLDAIVDGRLLVAIEAIDTNWPQETFAEVAKAIAEFEDGTVELATSTVGSFGSAVAGIINSENIRGTASRSDSTVVDSAPAASNTAAPVNVKAAMDNLKDVKL